MTRVLEPFYLFFFFEKGANCCLCNTQFVNKIRMQIINTEWDIMLWINVLRSAIFIKFLGQQEFLERYVASNGK